MLRHKNLIYGGEVIKKKNALTNILILIEKLIDESPLRVLGTCIIACLELEFSATFPRRLERTLLARGEKSPISTGRGNKITFLPRMDCFDYFDPRHGASRFPWSFKKLFLSSSFSVWEEDWGDIVR